MQNNTFSTLFVGQNIIKLISVDSTNNYLKNLTSNSEPLPEGTVIMAEHQFAGRGQQQNVWQTEPNKNLTFSVYLTPGFIRPERGFDINIMVSLALNNALSKYLPNNLSIKWPNDIYYGDKKIGGILIENTIMGSKLKHTIIGIGLNVNQLNFDKALTEIATSLSQILQQQIDLTTLLAEICTQLEQTYLNLRQGKVDMLRNLYTNKLYQLHKKAKYKCGEDVSEGVIQGLTDNGLLLIKATDGKLLTFGFKEVSFL